MREVLLRGEAGEWEAEMIAKVTDAHTRPRTIWRGWPKQGEHIECGHNLGRHESGRGWWRHWQWNESDREACRECFLFAECAVFWR